MTLERLKELIEEEKTIYDSELNEIKLKKEMQINFRCFDDLNDYSHKEKYLLECSCEQCLKTFGGPYEYYTFDNLDEVFENKKDAQMAYDEKYNHEFVAIKKELDEIKNILLYKMVVYPAETQDEIQWNVEFENISGVGGAGDTSEEAIKDAQQNLKVHLDFLNKNKK